MAKWGKIGGRGRRGNYFSNAYSYACLSLVDGELLSSGYRTAQPIATEIDEAVQGFLDGVTQINVPNSRTFCAAVREQYEAAKAAQNAASTEVEVA